MQLGMPYSTAFNHLPPTVDRNILGLKKECSGYIKQELAHVNSAHLGNYTSIQNYFSHNLHLKNVVKQEAKMKFPNKAIKYGKHKDDSDEAYSEGMSR